jgi:hypothetical protein
MTSSVSRQTAIILCEAPTMRHVGDKFEVGLAATKGDLGAAMPTATGAPSNVRVISRSLERTLGMSRFAPESRHVQRQCLLCANSRLSRLSYASRKRRMSSRHPATKPSRSGSPPSFRTRRLRNASSFCAFTSAADACERSMRRVRSMRSLTMA